MEHQPIIIAPNVFESIRDYFSLPNANEIDLKLYRRNLRLKRLVLDGSEEESNLYEQIKTISINSSDLAKTKIDAILKTFLKSGRVEFYLLTNKKDICDNPQVNQILNLASETSTRIINTEKKDIKISQGEIDVIKKIELLSIEEVNKPPNLSSIFNFERLIILSKDDEYNLFELLKYYWINTKSLIIEDDYLRNELTQFPKLIELIRTCKNLMKLKIRTNLSDPSQKDYVNERTGKLIKYIPANEFEDKIIASTEIKPIIEDKKVGTRRYITDYFELQLEKGLDFFNEKQSYRVWRNKVNIIIYTLPDSGIV